MAENTVDQEFPSFEGFDIKLSNLPPIVVDDRPIEGAWGFEEVRVPSGTYSDVRIVRGPGQKPGPIESLIVEGEEEEEEENVEAGEEEEEEAGVGEEDDAAGTRRTSSTSIATNTTSTSTSTSASASTRSSTRKRAGTSVGVAPLTKKAKVQPSKASKKKTQKKTKK